MSGIRCGVGMWIKPAEGEHNEVSITMGDQKRLLIAAILVVVALVLGGLALFRQRQEQTRREQVLPTQPPAWFGREAPQQGR